VLGTVIVFLATLGLQGHGGSVRHICSSAVGGAAFVVFINLKTSMLGKVVVVGKMVAALMSRAVKEVFVEFVVFSALGIAVREAIIMFMPVLVFSEILCLLSWGLPCEFSAWVQVHQAHCGWFWRLSCIHLWF
jgi:hypothetical protein